MTNEAWKQYRGDFNAMTDEEIEREVRSSEEQLDEAESWLEAVASWKAAGKPRDRTPGYSSASTSGERE